MSIPLQLLLRLPPALRCHAATSFLRQTNGPTRMFSRSSNRLQSKPPKPTVKRPSQPTRTPDAANQPPRAPPKPQERPKTNHFTPDSTLRAFFESNNSHLLLYRAPQHTSFYITSYLLGSCLLTGGVFQIVNLYEAPATIQAKQQEGTRPKWWAQSVSWFSAILLSAFATAFFLAPVKLVKSVTLVKSSACSGSRGAGLLFEVKHPFPPLQYVPFTKNTGGGSIGARIGQVFIDRNVTASANLSYYSVPAEDGQIWTADYFTPAPPEPRSILSRLQAINSSLVNAWPTLRQDIRRMFTRDGMAYVRIPEHGIWKMDLYHCSVLEQGRILEKLCQINPEAVDRGFGTWIKEKLGGETDLQEPSWKRFEKEEEQSNQKGRWATAKQAMKAGMNVTDEEHKRRVQRWNRQ